MFMIIFMSMFMSLFISLPMCMHIHMHRDMFMITNMDRNMDTTLTPTLIMARQYRIFQNAGMPDLPVFGRSNIRTEKTNDARTSTVLYCNEWSNLGHFFVRLPDWDYGCRKTDASVSFLDADAQLCLWGVFKINSKLLHTQDLSKSLCVPFPLR